MFKNDKGFSLLEVIIAAGLAGGMMLMVSKMQKQQQQIVKQADEAVTVKFFQEKIKTILSNSTTCKELLTVVPFDTPQRESANGGVDLGSFYKVGEYIDAKTKSQSQSKVKILGFLTVSPDFPTIEDGEQTVYLKVLFERDRKGQIGGKTFSKRYEFTAEINSQKIISCSGPDSAIMQSAKKELCRDIGGYINTKGKCDLSGVVARIVAEALLGGTESLVADQMEIFQSGSTTASDQKPLPGSISKTGKSSCDKGYKLQYYEWFPKTCGIGNDTCTTVAGKSTTAPTCTYSTVSSNYNYLTKKCTAKEISKTVCQLN